jgi:hypothetical protein
MLFCYSSGLYLWKGGGGGEIEEDQGWKKSEAAGGALTFSVLMVEANFSANGPYRSYQPVYFSFQLKLGYGWSTVFF